MYNEYEEQTNGMEHYDEFLVYEENVNSLEDQRNKLVWHHIYTIGTLLSLTASFNFNFNIGSLSELMEEVSWLTEIQTAIIVTLVVIVLCSIGRGVLKAMTAVQLLRGRKDGLKLLQLNTMVSYAICGIKILFAILAIGLITCGVSIPFLDGDTKTIATIVVCAIMGGSILINGGIIALITFNRKYYKKHEHLFTL